MRRKKRKNGFKEAEKTPARRLNLTRGRIAKKFAVEFEVVIAKVGFSSNTLFLTAEIQPHRVWSSFPERFCAVQLEQVAKFSQATAHKDAYMALEIGRGQNRGKAGKILQRGVG